MSTEKIESRRKNNFAYLHVDGMELWSIILIAKSDRSMDLDFLSIAATLQIGLLLEILKNRVLSVKMVILYLFICNNYPHLAEGNLILGLFFLSFFFSISHFYSLIYCFSVFYNELIGLLEIHQLQIFYKYSPLSEFISVVYHQMNAYTDFDFLYKFP